MSWGTMIRRTPKKAPEKVENEAEKDAGEVPAFIKVEDEKPASDAADSFLDKVSIVTVGADGKSKAYTKAEKAAVLGSFAK